MLKKIISGGQTGADRAALDVAINMNIPHGGWLPKGRRTEKGPLPKEYLLREMDDPSYAKRTEANVLDSDGTLIFSTNFRRFKFDIEAFPEFQIADISARTIPEDFKRNQRIHHCFKLTSKG